MAALFGDDILSLKYYWFRELELDGIPVIVTRTGWTAEVGYEVYLRDGSRGTALWERIMEAGKPFDIRPTGPVDIRRVEGGILNWGADMTIANNPFEVGLERLCHLDGDFEFKGKDALRRIRDEGVSRKLVGVEIGGEKLEMNFTKWPVHADGAPVGEVTTALWSPRLEKNIGYAWLPIELATNGTSVDGRLPRWRARGDRRADAVHRPDEGDPEVLSPLSPAPRAKGGRMRTVTSRAGAEVSCAQGGKGPALLLVHGSLSDHDTNWQAARDALERQFTLYRMCRRGDGTTRATNGHSVEDEADDVAAIISAIGGPVNVLGHSYGAHCALAGSARARNVERLVLYEPPKPSAMPPEALERIEELAAHDDWDGLVAAFMRDALRLPPDVIDAARPTDDWANMVADAAPSVEDWRALTRYDFDASQYRSMALPVLLLVGSESPNELYVTDALQAELPNVTRFVLEDQGHEAATTAPELFVRVVTEFLLGG